MPEEKIFEKDCIKVFRDDTPVEVYGVSYQNLKTAIEKLNPVASRKTIVRCLEKGMATEKAFEYIPNPGYANGIIYLITNKINDKQYIGLTIQSLDLRWQNHLEQAANKQIKSKNSLHAAIRKYGESVFKIEQIDSGTAKRNLEKKERFWIKEKKTLVPNGYNINAGGASGGSIKKPTEIDGFVFDSVKSAAEYLTKVDNISTHCAKWRIRKGKIHTLRTE